MNESKQGTFKDEVNIGDLVRFTVTSINIGQDVRRTKSVEGYVARMGMLYVYLSPTPVTFKIGFFRARFLPYYVYPHKYEVISRRT